MPPYRTLADLLAEAAADLADWKAAVVEYDEYKARRAVLETPTVAELNAQFDMGEEE